MMSVGLDLEAVFYSIDGAILWRSSSLMGAQEAMYMFRAIFHPSSLWQLAFVGVTAFHLLFQFYHSDVYKNPSILQFIWQHWHYIGKKVLLDHADDVLPLNEDPPISCTSFLDRLNSPADIYLAHWGLDWHSPIQGICAVRVTFRYRSKVKYTQHRWGCYCHAG